MIEVIDQDGNRVAVDVRIDGGPASTWIKPGRRHRIIVRPRRDDVPGGNVIALLVNRFEITAPPKGTADHWVINDIRINTKSQFSRVGDRPEDDGVPGSVFPKTDRPNELVCFDTLQTAMVFVIDVTYIGPNPEGQQFVCDIGCRVARGPFVEDVMESR